MLTGRCSRRRRLTLLTVSHVPSTLQLIISDNAFARLLPNPSLLRLAVLQLLHRLLVRVDELLLVLTVLSRIWRDEGGDELVVEDATAEQQVLHDVDVFIVSSLVYSQFTSVVRYIDRTGIGDGAVLDEHLDGAEVASGSGDVQCSVALGVASYSSVDLVELG